MHAKAPRRRPSPPTTRSLLGLLVLALSLVSLACTRSKPAPETETEADHGPVVLDLWAGVAPLTPEADDLMDELSPHPGPQKPAQVGEEIELPFPPPTPDTPPVGITVAPSADLEVLRQGPEGEHALVEAIRASFNHPMVPLASIEDLRELPVPLQIEPAVEGEFRWLGTRTVAFYPQGRLPFSTRYEIEIPAGTESTQGTTLAKAVRWSITTPSLALERSYPAAADDAHVVLDRPIVLRFNQPVDAEAITAALRLRGRGKSLALEHIPASRWGEDQFAPHLLGWVPSEDGWERDRIVVLLPKTPLDPNTRYSVELAPGVYGEGPLRSAKIKFKFKTYPPLKLSVGRCDPAPCSATYGIHLEASNQITDARIIDRVHVEPPVDDLRIDPSWRGIQISGDFEGERSYKVTVDAGIEDTFGQHLAKPFSATVKLGALERNLQVWPQTQHPAIIEASAGHTIKLQIAGQRELEIMAVSFGSDDIEKHYNSGTYGGHWPSNLGEPTYTKILDVADSRKRKRTLEIDVDELLTGTDNFVYLMARSETYTRWGYEQRDTLSQVIQVTNLGVSVALDREQAEILVTELDTGAPVAKADVQLMFEYGRRSVWKGVTDRDGVVRAHVPKGSNLRMIVLAQRNDDSVFLPLDTSDLEGRWVTGLLGTPAEDQVRAFMFTDREPYKPGEEVHLVGFVRRETKGPKGGVEAWGPGRRGTYKVTSPRGVEVQTGELQISSFGTFSVDIQTDKDGDTGQYRFELEYDSLFSAAESFSHSFAVEAFRTPDFQVEVERPSSDPLYFGDQLEVEIRGRYLFGAPMIGAEARYTLTRDDTNFRPPGEGLADFHFASSASRRGWHWGGSWGFGLSSLQLATGSEPLDSDGVVTVRHALALVEPPAPDAPKPPKTDSDPQPPRPQAATFTVSATVTDDNRQAIAGSGSFVVHPSAYYVGLRSERSVLKAGERTRVDAVVVDVDGQRIPDVGFSLKVLRSETTRKAVQNHGVWSFEYSTEKVETSACDLHSKATLTGCEIQVGEAGSHEIIAEIRDGEGRLNRAVLEIFVHGEDAVVWDRDDKHVDLVPDKSSYEPGETAKILVRSPFQEARGLLVVEREGMAQTHLLDVHGGVAVVEVEIEAEMVAGVTASAILSRPRTHIDGAPDDQDLGAPAAASGQIELGVSTASKTVFVEVTPAASTVEPGATLRIDLETRDDEGEPIAAELAVFVVDEGVLSLMGYSTPDPLSFFHYRRPGQVGLYADHPLILPREVAQQPSTSTTTPTPDEPNQQGRFFHLLGDATGEAYGVGGLGLSGTGGGGGGGGFGSGIIGHGGGTGTGSGYGLGGGKRNKDKTTKPQKGRPNPNSRATETAVPMAAPPPPASPAALDPNAAMAQEVSLRKLFATTAHFESELETGDDGRASIEIDMPENLTSFRIMVVAIDTQTHDRFGSGESSVRVRKSIMLRPSLPRFLNMGDRFEASVMVDNQSDSTQVVMAGVRGINVVLPEKALAETSIEIPAGESRELRFPLAVDRPGVMRLQFAALSNRGRDATEIEIPVLVPATKQAFADYGVTSSSVQRQVQIPEDALSGFGGLEVSMSSTALNGLEDAVEYLVSYRYECAEQTASRILPIFALGDVLDDFPIAEVHDRAHRDQLADAGIERLWGNQNWDGGFGYWGTGQQESWPYVSTWATLALLEGKKSGYAVDQDKLDRALGYLDNYIRNGTTTRWGSYYDWTSRAFALWLLAREDRGPELFDQVWAKRKRMPLYARVLLMSAAHRYGREAPVAEVLEELRASVVENARVIHFAESKTETSSQGLTLLMHSNTQTDAIVLMTLIELGEELDDDGMAPKIIAGIMADRDPRKGGRWTSTHANAWALMAAARYYEVVESETPDFKARIWLDATYAGEHEFKGRDMTMINQHVPMAALLGAAPGKTGPLGKVESLTLAKDGPGKLYYRLGLRYAPADFDMKPVDRGFTVSRRYEALPREGESEADPDAVQQLEDGSWVIEAGTNVLVSLTLTSQDRASYVVVDDALPAGFEGQNPRFSTSVGVRDVSTVDYGYGGYRYGTPQRSGFHFAASGFGWWFPAYTFDHKQMRDDRMLLFADWLPAGVYTYSYTARATNIGTFVLPPVHAEAMYEPERFGHGGSSTVEIVAAD